MDHLFLPQGARPDRIIYRGLKDYLGVPFLQYARHSGREFLLQLENPVTWEKYRRQHHIKHDDLASFLETWFFCGLLREVLGSSLESLGFSSLYNHNDFVSRIPRSSLKNTLGHRVKSPLDDAYERGEDKSFVDIFCTSVLLKRLDEWSSLIKGCNKPRETFDQLSKCMSIVFSVLHRIGLEYEEPSKLVICTTAETVGFAIKRTFEDVDLLDIKRLPTWVHLGWNQSQIEKLTTNGWCASEASGIMQKAVSLETLYFLAHMKRHYVNSRHKFCSVLRCRASWAIDKPLHFSSPDKPVHQISPDGRCDQGARIIGNMQSEILEIIDQNETPLLEITKSDQLGLSMVRIIPSTPQSRYIALSHVWADGLGNPNENSLPSCQIAHLHELVQELWLSAEGIRSSDILLWVDTICCPTNPKESKNKVLRKMRHIYEGATYVLVLDSELQQIDHRHLDPLEIGMRVLTSDWMKRLWTLQECHLARNVWIQFRDGPYNMDTLGHLMSDEQPVNRQAIVGYIKREFCAIRKRRAVNIEEGGSEFTLLGSATQSRQVSCPEDEPLCLGTILGFDLGPITKHVRSDDRMKEFWNLVMIKMGMHKSIIFRSGPRLQVDGYRWAPATMLNEHIQLGDNMIYLDRLSKFGKVYEGTLNPEGRGLEVRFKGYIPTAVGEINTGLLKLLPSESAVHNFNSCRIRDQHGHWHIFSHRPQQAFNEIAAKQEEIKTETNNIIQLVSTGRPCQYAFIVRDENTDGMLVEVQERTTRCIYARAVRKVNWVTESAKVFEAAYQNAQEISGHPDYPRITNSLNEGEAFRISDFIQALNVTLSPGLPNSQIFAQAQIEGFHLMQQSVRQAFVSDPSLESAAEAYSVDPESFFQSIVFLILANRFFSVAEALPETQLWCVD